MPLNNNVRPLCKQPAVPRPGGLDITADLHLLRELIKRDFVGRFTASALGVFWIVLQPAILVGVYWFVFTYMIPMRGLTAGGVSYIYFLLSGLLPWMAVNEGLMRGMTSIVENAPMVRRLPLRSELLVIVPNVSALLFETVALILFMIVWTMTHGLPSTAWLLPFALALQLALQIGISLMLAATFVFFRDLAQILGFILSVLFYLSPILYQPSGRFAKFFAWNPLTPLVGLFRSALLGSPLPDVPSIVFLLVVTAAAGIASMLFFRRVQPDLVDLV